MARKSVAKEKPKQEKFVTGVFRRNVEFSVGDEDIFYLVVKYARAKPKVVKQILEALMFEVPKAGQFINCPFPSSCNDFPCKALRCSADECDNGCAFRRS